MEAIIVGTSLRKIGFALTLRQGPPATVSSVGGLWRSVALGGDSAGSPCGVDFVLLTGISAVAKHATDVAHHDGRLRHRARQRDHIGELRMIAPGVERQPVRGEPRHTGADVGPRVDMGAESGRLLPMVGSGS